MSAQLYWEIYNPPPGDYAVFPSDIEEPKLNRDRVILLLEAKFILVKISFKEWEREVIL